MIEECEVRTCPLKFLIYRFTYNCIIDLSGINFSLCIVIVTVFSLINFLLKNAFIKLKFPVSYYNAQDYSLY